MKRFEIGFKPLYDMVHIIWIISKSQNDMGQSKKLKILNFCNFSKKSNQKLESRNEKDSESNLIQNQILKWVLYSQFIELSLNPYLRHNIWNHFNPNHSITAHSTRWIQSYRYQWLLNHDSWGLIKSQARVDFQFDLGVQFDLQKSVQSRKFYYRNGSNRRWWRVL